MKQNQNLQQTYAPFTEAEFVPLRASDFSRATC